MLSRHAYLAVRADFDTARELKNNLLFGLTGIGMFDSLEKFAQKRR